MNPLNVISHLPQIIQTVYCELTSSEVSNVSVKVQDFNFFSSWTEQMAECVGWTREQMDERKDELKQAYDRLFGLQEKRSGLHALLNT